VGVGAEPVGYIVDLVENVSEQEVDNEVGAAEEITGDVENFIDKLDETEWKAATGKKVVGQEKIVDSFVETAVDDTKGRIKQPKC